MRLIDADALIEEICSDCRKDVREMCKDDPFCGSVSWITEAPTIDPESLRPKGRCKFCEGLDRMREVVNYCPVCGADVRGEDDE